MQSVPDHRAEKTKDISDETRDRDERNGRRWIEWLDEVHRLDHVRPENEIENRLRPADQNKKRPSYMPAADQHGDHQPNVTRIGHTRCSLLGGLTGASAGRNPRAKLARRLAEHALKGAIELRQ